MTRVERKVSAASISAAVAGAVLYVLGHYVFKGEIPGDIQTLVYIAVPAVCSFVAGWLARHTDIEFPEPSPTRSATHPEPFK